jgi:hypothetical protein
VSFSGSKWDISADIRRTKLIQDASSSRPVYTGTINGTIAICRTEGFGGIYRGLVPTVGVTSFLGPSKLHANGDVM